MLFSDLENDTLTPVAILAETRTGRRPCPATIWRWRVKGCHGVKLQAVLVGSRWCTTSAAFAEFIRAQTVARDATREEDCAPREREAEMTRRLQAAGIL